MSYGDRDHLCGYCGTYGPCVHDRPAPEARGAAAPRPPAPAEVEREQAVIGRECHACKKTVWFADEDSAWDPEWRCDRCRAPALYARIDALEERVRKLEDGKR